jgi:hypothetical protein
MERDRRISDEDVRELYRRYAGGTERVTKGGDPPGERG